MTTNINIIHNLSLHTFLIFNIVEQESIRHKHIRRFDEEKKDNS